MANFYDSQALANLYANVRIPTSLGSSAMSNKSRLFLPGNSSSFQAKRNVSPKWNSAMTEKEMADQVPTKKQAKRSKWPWLTARLIREKLAISYISSSFLLFPMPSSKLYYCYYYYSTNKFMQIKVVKFFDGFQTSSLSINFFFIS